MAKRRKFSKEFKQEAVELTRDPDVSISQVAHDLGIHSNLLGRWRRELMAEKDGAFKGSGSARDQEVVALKRELARVKKERDFLKDAAAFFARESS